MFGVGRSWWLRWAERDWAGDMGTVPPAESVIESGNHGNTLADRPFVVWSQIQLLLDETRWER